MNSEPQHPSKKERREIRKKEKELARLSKHRKRFAKRVLLWSSVLIGASALVIGLVKLASETPPATSPQAGSPAEISPQDWVKGNPDANVTLIEYSDFQCPACAAYFPILKQLNEDLGNRMRFAYRHFPLKQIHPHAELAAQSAQAAGRQGKFWEMHDLIFDRQAEWSKEHRPLEIFTGFAGDLGLDVAQFRKDLDSREVRDAVEHHLQGGLRAGVNSTPTFFLNGVIIQNPRSYGDFRRLIEQATDHAS